MVHIIPATRSFKLFTILLALVANSPAIPSFAQPGTIDLTFNSTDLGFGIGGGALGGALTILAVKYLPDGKILIAGTLTNYNGTISYRIARLHPDGKIDPSFVVGSGAKQYDIYRRCPGRW